MKNKKMFRAGIFIILAAITIKISGSAECTIIRNIFDARAFRILRETMDEIERKNLAYSTHSSRTGIMRSDVLVNTSNSSIVKELNTKKISAIEGDQQKAQSFMDYPDLLSLVCADVFPRIFEKIKTWQKEKEFPEMVFSQIFLQRCTTSDEIDWRQDLGEDYDQQPDYSLILMLSHHNDPKYGWDGGSFKIKIGSPKDTCDEDHIATIAPFCNQGIFFNNQLISHSETPAISKTETSRRDLMIISLSTTKMPTLIEKAEPKDKD